MAKWQGKVINKAERAHLKECMIWTKKDLIWSIEHHKGTGDYCGLCMSIATKVGIDTTRIEAIPHWTQFH